MSTGTVNWCPAGKQGIDMNIEHYMNYNELQSKCQYLPFNAPHHENKANVEISLRRIVNRIHQSFGNVSFRDRQEWFDSR